MKKEVINMNLKIGKMTSKELAEWFGIAYSTYRKTTAKHLETLKDYCDYEQIYGGVIISQIYISEYNKNMYKNIDEQFFKAIIANPEHLASITGICGYYGVFEGDTEYNHLRYQFSKRRDYWFGHQTRSERTSKGPMGQRTAVWAVRLGDNNSYRSLTDQEQELIKKLVNTIEITSDDILSFGNLLRENQLTIAVEDLNKAGLNYYDQVLSKFKSITHAQLVIVDFYEFLHNWAGRTPQETEYIKQLKKSCDLPIKI